HGRGRVADDRRSGQPPRLTTKVGVDRHFETPREQVMRSEVNDRECPKSDPAAECRKVGPLAAVEELLDSIGSRDSRADVVVLDDTLDRGCKRSVSRESEREPVRSARRTDAHK